MIDKAKSLGAQAAFPQIGGTTCTGLTKRELFTGLFMASLLGHPDHIASAVNKVGVESALLGLVSVAEKAADTTLERLAEEEEGK